MRRTPGRDPRPPTGLARPGRDPDSGPKRKTRSSHESLLLPIVPVNLVGAYSLPPYLPSSVSVPIVLCTLTRAGGIKLLARVSSVLCTSVLLSWSIRILAIRQAPK